MRKTKNQIEWERQVARIKKFIRRKEKEGFIFEDNLIPDRPKRITANQLKFISLIRPNQLYQRSKFISPETGKEYSGTQAKREKLYREDIRKIVEKGPTNEPFVSQAQPKIEFKIPNTIASIDIANFRQEISGFREEFQQLMESWIDSLISRYGIECVGEMLANGRENGLIITNKIAYSTSETYNYMSDMMSYLPDPDEFYSDNDILSDEYYEGMTDDEKESLIENLIGNMGVYRFSSVDYSQRADLVRKLEKIKGRNEVVLQKQYNAELKRLREERNKNEK